MPLARPLLFGAILLALALPGHPLAWLSGLPLGLPSICLVLLVAGWALALPGQPPRAKSLAVAVLVVAALRVSASAFAPAYGLVGEYRTDDKPGAVVVDRSLELRGDLFPVHFFNDVRRFNFYTPNDPKRDLLPFSVRWSGLLVVPEAGPRTLTLEANGLATVELGSPETGGVRRASIDRPGRLREATLAADLPAGLVPIVVTYQRSDEAMPWFELRGASGLVQMGTSLTAVAREIWLRPLGLALDGLLVGLLGLAFAGHLWARLLASRPSHDRPTETRPADESDRHQPVRAAGWWPLGGSERVLLAIYLVLVVGWELAGHLHLFGRAVILSGGNDWLAYEGFARDLLTNGPLLTEGRALGQGVPFYYQPLYIYWVALTHLILGASLFAPLFMNTVLGVAAGLGLYLLTRELFGRVAAVAALLLFEACRQTFFAQTAGLLLSENLLFPLVPIFLLLLVRLAKTGRLLTAVGAGIVLGLGGLARTTPLALLPPALLILLLAWRPLSLAWIGLPSLTIGGERSSVSWTGIVSRLALFVVVVFLTLGLATTRNYVVSGRPVLITSSAGANLWETHRPSAKVDLSRIDKDPLYERLGLDRQTREVVEFARQDPGGYIGTLVPMFLYAVGVVGAVSDTWDVHPGLFGVWLAYLATTVLVPRARAVPTWFIHAFIWSHLAQMTVFFSHQYGFRLVLPMYVAMVPIVAVGAAALVARIGRLLAPVGTRLPASAPMPPTARVSLIVLALAGSAAGLGAGEWSGGAAAREAFYGLNSDAAIAARQAVRPELVRRADVTYFVGDDSRSTDVAYLNGLAFPALRWFDGARGLVLPPQGEEALYIAPDRAAADFARQCLGEGASIGRERDPLAGAGLELFVATAGAGECAAPRELLGAAFAEGTVPNAILVGLDAPASIEPGRAMDVLIHWDAVSRPRNRARPFVRLVDSRGRRWGQAETTAYPSSSWRPGERVVGVARLDVDPTLPPGSYQLEGGFSAGSGQARVTESGPWGGAGLAQARGSAVRLVSRSAPIAADSLTLDRRLDATLDGARLLGVDFDREAALAGERVRVTLFWERAGARAESHEVSLIVRQRGSGTAIQEWRGLPVDGTYPMTDWKPGEIVRDTWDLTLPATLPAGEVELAVGLASGQTIPQQYVALGTVAVRGADRQLTEPQLRGRVDASFANGAQLLGFDLKSRRVKAGDNIDLTLVWRTGAPLRSDLIVTVALLDEGGRPLAQQESEPAGGKRPTSGWTSDEYVEDGWKLRMPRELPRGGVRLAVSLVDPATNTRVQTAGGSVWADLPIEVGAE